MTLIGMITLNSTDYSRAAHWWKERLNATVAGDYPGFMMLQVPGLPALLGFQQVTEVADETRVHLDLEADPNLGREASVQAFVDAGASRVDSHQPSEDFGWDVLRDPFGMIFCLSDAH
ncbi:VOC family protein [Glutamicibacter sp. X7]